MFFYCGGAHVTVYPVGKVTGEAVEALSARLTSMILGGDIHGVIVNLKFARDVEHQAAVPLRRLALALQQQAIPLIACRASLYLSQMLRFGGVDIVVPIVGSHYDAVALLYHDDMVAEGFAS